MTTWQCPVPECDVPYRDDDRRASAEAYAAEHLGVLPDAEQLSEWRMERVRTALGAHLSTHSPAEIARMARPWHLVPSSNPGTVER